MKEQPMDLILHFLLLGVAIFVMAESMPGIKIQGFGTAIIVAIVYGLINITLGTVLKFIAIPFIVVTVGLFLILINTFLLWLTDQMLDDFEIEDIGSTFIAAVIITISDTLLGWIF
jgi:putative membrane protein